MEDIDEKKVRAIIVGQGVYDAMKFSSVLTKDAFLAGDRCIEVILSSNLRNGEFIVQYENGDSYLSKEPMIYDPK